MKKVKKKNEDCKRYSPSSEFTPNYCGSQEGVAKFTYHLIPDFILGQDCNCHDYAYFYGGCKSIDDKNRFKADKEFYQNMKHRVSTLPWYRRYYYQGIIWSYYKFVRKFGHNSFNWFDTPFQWSCHLIKNGYDATFIEQYVTSKGNKNG
jgi:hypothetical protein